MSCRLKPPSSREATQIIEVFLDIVGKLWIYPSSGHLNRENGDRWIWGIHHCQTSLIYLFCVWYVLSYPVPMGWKLWGHSLWLPLGPLCPASGRGAGIGGWQLWHPVTAGLEVKWSVVSVSIVLFFHFFEHEFVVVNLTRIHCSWFLWTSWTRGAFHAFQ